MPGPTAVRRIGILTSGGDCAGLNAVIRAVTMRAVDGWGMEVVGIEEGTRGVMERPHRFRMLTPAAFDGDLLRRGGTMLGTTNKGNPFAFPTANGTVDRSQEVADGFAALALDGLIAIGGDGSMKIVSALAAKAGLPMVGIPKTIDNDVAPTEVSVGFDTAVEVATEALDRLQPTAASHSRVMVLEVMGRDAGHIALSAGIAGGADVILIPEIAYDIDLVAAKIAEIRRRGRNFALVVVAEAVPTPTGEAVQSVYAGGEARYGGIGHEIGAQLATRTSAESRVTVLGHVQRGSAPSPRDRLIASAFGVHAVDLLAAGIHDRLVVWRDRGVVDVPLEDAVADAGLVDVAGALVTTARGLGICLGDR